jgi:hypothetical protein
VIRACHCTNQCHTCGQCCRVPCGHRAGSGGYTTTTSTPWQPAPAPVEFPRPAPLTEEQVRRIVREELGRKKKAK